jgi:DNA-binding PadR family transcriptional regulator
MSRSFVNSELTLFSYEILGLVGESGLAPHDLRALVQRGRILAWAGESQYYTEPKRLAALGYLTARKEPGKTRDRTVYTLTDQGREALRAYAATPVTVVPFKSDALLRLLICDLVGEEVTREGMASLRDDVADLRERLAEASRAAAELPHRAAYLEIVNHFLEGLLDLHVALADEVDELS